MDSGINHTGCHIKSRVRMQVARTLSSGAGGEVGANSGDIGGPLVESASSASAAAGSGMGVLGTARGVETADDATVGVDVSSEGVRELLFRSADLMGCPLVRDGVLSAARGGES